MSRKTRSDCPAACPCCLPVAYADCCGRYHAGIAAPTAEALMRSRYSAYVLQLTDYLHTTWAPETCPADLEASTPAPQWLGLQVLAHQADGDTATVEFVAKYKVNGRAGRLHERSRFRREGGRWCYIDGSFPDAA